MPTGVSFVVLTAGRSGSSFIRGALQSHPDVLSFGELLEDPDSPQVRDKDVTLREKRADESVRRYCDRIVFAPRLRYGAVGFKVKYYHFEGNRLAAYLQERDVVIVHNKRRNILAQSLSLPLAMRHEFSDRLDDPDHEGRYRYPVRVDPANVIARAEDNLETAAAFDRLFRQKLPVLDVFYEDFCVSAADGRLRNQAEVDRLLRFLGVQPRPLRSQFARQRWRSYRQLIHNFDELLAAIRALHPEWAHHVAELESTEDLV
jgi:hypothetical protein